MARRSGLSCRGALVASTILAATLTSASAQDLVLYGAGSLRESMTEITRTFGAAHGLTIKTDFAYSGKMRERIEAGETVDVFTSADIGHPARLVKEGRAEVMAQFAKNTLCLLSTGRVGTVTPETVLDVMLRDGVKIGVYPTNDPLGAYSVKLFDLADTVRPNSSAALKSRAVLVDSFPARPPEVSGNAEVDALIDGRLDVILVYCSGASRYEAAKTKAPDAGVALTHLPPALNVGPEYGLALIKHARPASAALALFILSPDGQQILKKHGFLPIALPSDQ